MRHSFWLSAFGALLWSGTPLAAQKVASSAPAVVTVRASVAPRFQVDRSPASVRISLTNGGRNLRFTVEEIPDPETKRGASGSLILIVPD